MSSVASARRQQVVLFFSCALNAFSIREILLCHGTGLNLMFNYGFLLLILFGISFGASDSCTFHSLFTSGTDLEAFAASSIL